MSNEIMEIVKSRIVARHQGDERQLEVIFSPESRILVEAPAGYGKTNTMVSKIAYMIATKQIPNPKKLLALTFSVNAAYKIKKDVSQQIPALLADTGLEVNIGDKIFVSNYHGFCRSVLRKYGYSFHSALQAIDTLQSFDDGSVRHNQETIKGLTYGDATFMARYCEASRNGEETFLVNHLSDYCNIVIKEYIPQGYISYNAILTLTLKLFSDFPKILEFYHLYYSSLLIDEYQDTNFLSYVLVSYLIAEKTKVILLGDSLQRIYGFIGAVQNLLDNSAVKFSLKKIQLTKNYRFASNPEMLQLDSNIRRNAEKPSNPSIIADAKIEFGLYETQDQEALEVVRKAVKLIQSNAEKKVAILVKQRGDNVDAIIKALESKDVPYFYGLFTDDDHRYIQFHKKALFEFIELLKTKNQVTKKVGTEHIKKLKEIFKEQNDTVSNALLGLLQIFWSKIFSDFPSFSNDDKISLIKDTFELSGLKQYIEFVESKIIVSTVHAAKGLEWDYVLIPDMEQNSFPSYQGNLCKRGGCAYKSNCDLKIDKSNEIAFLEELSVFYVAVTRAKIQVFFTASKENTRGYKNNVSCLLKLKGIRY